MTALTYERTTAAKPGRRRMPLSLRLAMRDLRGGLSGFYILFFCIALGTGAIGAVNSISEALQAALARDGKMLLGGDIEAALIHRRANVEERAFLEGSGKVSEIATLRAMARKPDGSTQALIDLKAVDGAYPLYGNLVFENGVPVSAVVSSNGLAVDATLLEKLNVKLGDEVSIGRASFKIAAVVAEEPDKLAAGPAFGARALLSVAALEKTGLIDPGSLIRWSYRIRAGNPGSPALTKETLAKRFPEAGFLVRDSSDPSPGITSSIKRLNDFLTLVALTAMITGGIGIANAVATFVERRRKSIATFKAVGATQAIVFKAFLTEVGILAALGIAAGLVLAVAMPIALVAFAGGAIPIGIDPGPYAQALAVAALFGVLTVVPFVLWPLGRAQEVRAAELFRSESETGRRFPPQQYILASLAGLLALGATAVLFSTDKRVAAVTCLALTVVFALFWLVGLGIRAVAASAPRSRRAELALAILNIAGPASLSRTIALSLGTGLTVLTTVSLVQASLTDELQNRLPVNAPSHFFIGIKKNDLQGVTSIIREAMPDAKVTTAPMLRGRIVALKGIPVEQYKAPANAEWVVNGDRGLTYSETLPSGSAVVEGSWWKPDYSGENLVSFETEIGKGLGLHLGDSVTVNVLGRNISAKIANFRTVQWGSVEINFVMIFSPNALRQAPFTYLATLGAPEKALPDRDGEAAAVKALGAAYPEVTVIRVRDVLSAVNGVFEKIMRAVRIAGSITLVMGGLVVAGALISAQRSRIYEAVVLRTLGASRRRIVAAHLIEYAILSICLAVCATGLGLVLSYFVITQVMGLSFNLSLGALLQPSAIATISVLALGAVGTLRVLSVKPARYLRQE